MGPVHQQRICYNEAGCTQKGVLQVIHRRASLQIVNYLQAVPMVK